MKRGEIRWSERDGGWEVLIPTNAFRNANASFSGSKPFHLVLPNLQDLIVLCCSMTPKIRAPCS